MAFPSFFAIVVGLGMLAQWTMSLLTRQVPELKTEPIRIGFHLAAEAATAITLIVAGVGRLRGSVWAPVLYPVAIGMLLYTAIVSPGYFAQRGRWTWALIFGLLITLALVSLFLTVA